MRADFGGGAVRDADFTIDSGQPDSTYFADANRETFIFAQIETPQAVANADEIAAVEGIDALFLGPADLGLRLAAAPPADGLTLANAIERVASIVRRRGKGWGITAGSIGADQEYDAFLKKIAATQDATLVFLVRSDGWYSYVRAAGWAESSFNIKTGKLPIPGKGTIDLGQFEGLQAK